MANIVTWDKVFLEFIERFSETLKEMNFEMSVESRHGKAEGRRSFVKMGMFLQDASLLGEAITLLVSCCYGKRRSGE